MVDTLEAAGWSVEIDLFDFTVAQPIQQLTPAPPSRGGGRQRPGTVTAQVVPVDLVPPRANTSGCQGTYTEAAVGAPLTLDPGGVDDFAGFPTPARSH